MFLAKFFSESIGHNFALWFVSGTSPTPLTRISTELAYTSPQSRRFALIVGVESFFARSPRGSWLMYRDNNKFAKIRSGPIDEMQKHLAEAETEIARLKAEITELTKQTRSTWSRAQERPILGYAQGRDGQPGMPQGI
jgi:hypothetical protein